MSLFMSSTTTAVCQMYTRGFRGERGYALAGKLRKRLARRGATAGYCVRCAGKNKNQMSRKFNSTFTVFVQVMERRVAQRHVPAKPVPCKSFNEQLTHSYANVMG